MAFWLHSRSPRLPRQRRASNRRAHFSLATLLLLFPPIAGCGSQDQAGAGGGDGGSPIDEAAFSDEQLLAEATARQNAAAQALVASAMAAIVDPATARYRNVRPGLGGSACGEVGTPSGKEPGPFRPFVVTPEGVAVISATPELTFRDPNDLFPDLYIRWCATPEELQKIGPELKRGPFSPDEANLATGATEVPSLPELSLPTDSAPAPPTAPPSPEKIDRFEEAVRRKQP